VRLYFNDVSITICKFDDFGYFRFILVLDHVYVYKVIEEIDRKNNFVYFYTLSRYPLTHKGEPEQLVKKQILKDNNDKRMDNWFMQLLWTGMISPEGVPEFVIPMINAENIVMICTLELEKIASVDKDRFIQTIPETYPNFIFFWNKSDIETNSMKRLNLKTREIKQVQEVI